MAKTFPTFKSHEEAACFNCGSRLYQAPKASGYGEANGSYLKQCPCCGMSTWYDVRAKVQQ